MGQGKSDEKLCGEKMMRGRALKPLINEPEGVSNEFHQTSVPNCPHNPLESNFIRVVSTYHKVVQNKIFSTFVNVQSWDDKFVSSYFSFVQQYKVL